MPRTPGRCRRGYRGELRRTAPTAAMWALSVSARDGKIPGRFRGRSRPHLDAVPAVLCAQKLARACVARAVEVATGVPGTASKATRRG